MPTLPTLADLYSARRLDDLVPELRAFKDLSPAEQIDYACGLVRDTPQMSAWWGRGWSYRRVRPLDPDQQLSSHTDLIWNSTKPARAGRFNPEGVPMFYAGDGVFTAFREGRIDTGRVAMTTFQVQANRCFRVATFGELALLERSGRGYFLLGTKDAAAQTLGFVKAGRPDRVLAAMMIDTFLLESLQDPSEEYGLSNSVATAVFEKHPEINAFAYPSVRQRGSVCIAVRTEGFWDVWGVQAVHIGQATHLGLGYYNFQVEQHASAIDPTGNISWAGSDRVLPAFSSPWHPGLNSIQGASMRSLA